MVRLYLLGFTHDLKGVVFGQRKSAKTGTFWVPIDEAFLGAVDKLERARQQRDRGQQPAGRTLAKASKDVVSLKELPPARSRALPPVGRSVARSGLPASEIQQMLREGKSIKTVAASAKTELAWVERLAEPVITERVGVVKLAQRAYMLRPRLGTAGLQLGEAVRRNLEERGVDSADDIWDARAARSGVWRVWVRYTHRGKRRSAEWEFRKGSRQITARNRLAGELGWWTPEIADDIPELAAPGEGEGEETTGAASDQPVVRRRTAKRRRTPARRPKTKAKPKRAQSRRKPAKGGSRRPTARRRG